MSKVLFAFLFLAGLITFVHAKPSRSGPSEGIGIFLIVAGGVIIGIGLIYLLYKKIKVSNYDSSYNGQVVLAPWNDPEFGIHNDRSLSADSINDKDKAYNHGQEAIVISENDNILQNYIIQALKKPHKNNYDNSAGQIQNQIPAAYKVYNHGQEAIENDNNNNNNDNMLQNYITQVVNKLISEGKIESQIHSDQVISAASTENKVYNHGQEAIPISENDNNNQTHNEQGITAASTNDNKVYNHGQEAIPVFENNNDNLQNYIAKIVKQEITKAIGNNISNSN